MPRLADAKPSRAIAVTISFAIAISLAGCAGTQNQTAPASVATPVASAPLKLCPSPDTPPADVVSKPGYAQFFVSVADAQGNPVSGLKQSDFAASVGSQTTPIVYFHADDNRAPVSIVILMDETGSMEHKLVVQDADRRTAIRAKIEAVVHKLSPCDEVAIVEMGGEPSAGGGRVEVLQRFTTDHDLLVKEIGDTRPFGQTSLFDGIEQALALLRHADYSNRAIIVITDGLDNASDATTDEVLAKARNAGVPIYAVGIGNPDGSNTPSLALGPFIVGGGDIDRVDLKTIQKISSVPGGHLYHADELARDDGASFVDDLNQIAGLLGSGYAIGVTMPSGSEWSADAPPDIQFAVANPPGAIVTVRHVTVAPTAKSP